MISFSVKRFYPHGISGNLHHVLFANAERTAFAALTAAPVNRYSVLSTLLAPPEDVAAYGAAHTGRKRREPGILSTCHVVSHQIPLTVFVFISPAVFLCRRYPVPGDCLTIFQIENHGMVLRYQDFVYLFQKNCFVEFFQAEDRSAFFMQHFSRNSAPSCCTCSSLLYETGIPILLNPLCHDGYNGRSFCHRYRT